MLIITLNQIQYIKDLPWIAAGFDLYPTCCVFSFPDASNKISFKMAALLVAFVLPYLTTDFHLTTNYQKERLSGIAYTIWLKSDLSCSSELCKTIASRFLPIRQLVLNSVQYFLSRFVVTFHIILGCSLLRSKGQSFRNTFRHIKVTIWLVNIVTTDTISNGELSDPL